MQKRNILYELKDQLRKGTLESQIDWSYDPVVQAWSKHYYILWNKVVTEIPNVACRKQELPKIRGNQNRKTILSLPVSK